MTLGRPLAECTIGFISVCAGEPAAGCPRERGGQRRAPAHARTARQHPRLPRQDQGGAHHYQRTESIRAGRLISINGQKPFIQYFQDPKKILYISNPF